MSIEEEKVGWKPINLTFAQAKYPQPVMDLLPRHCFVACVAGARNSGKTFAVCQMIRQQEKHGVKDTLGRKVPIRTIVVSPTALMNPVFGSLESLEADDIHVEYSDQLIREIIEDIKDKRDKAEEYERQVELFRKMLRMQKESDLTMEELFELQRMNFELPPPPEYYPAPITNLILDDLVGSAALRQGRNPVMNLILRNRHHLTNIFICTQAIRQVPKAIRNNANVYLIFRYANSKMVLDDFYPEVSNVLKEDEFEALYEHATAGEDHPFLFADFTKPKEDYFRKAFDTYIRIKR
jgi:hypothetical protein